jgi:hypothetical protein
MLSARAKVLSALTKVSSAGARVLSARTRMLSSGACFLYDRARVLSAIQSRCCQKNKVFASYNEGVVCTPLTIASFTGFFIANICDFGESR